MIEFEIIKHQWKNYRDIGFGVMLQNTFHTYKLRIYSDKEFYILRKGEWQIAYKEEIQTYNDDTFCEYAEYYDEDFIHHAWTIWWKNTYG